MKSALVAAAVLLCGATAVAAPAAPIRVSGRHLVDDKGNCVRLAGAMHPFHPYFCGNRLATGNDELHIPAPNGSLDFGYGPKNPVGRSDGFAALFKAVPRIVDGKTYCQIRCYGTNCVLRTGWLEGGNADTLCAHPGGGLVEGVCRENGAHSFGQDQDGDGLWEVAEVPGGFTFKNRATGKYLGGPSARQSQTPVVWECTTRAVPPKGARR